MSLLELIATNLKSLFPSRVRRLARQDYAERMKRQRELSERVHEAVVSGEITDCGL